MSDPTPAEMLHERAIDIVAAINARAWLLMGLRDDLSGLFPLADVTLAQMVEATASVRAENERRAAAGGSYRTHVIPDDRLIAAVYAVEHYRPSGEAIVATIVDGRDQLLAVFYANAGTEGDAS